MQSIYLKYSPYEIELDLARQNVSDEVQFDYALDALKKHIDKIAMQNVQMQVRFEEQKPSGSLNFRYFINMHPSGKLFSYHSHDFFECNLVVSGKCLEYIDNQPYILESGDILLMSAGYLPHSCYGEPDARIYNLMFSTDFFTELMTDSIHIPQFFMKKLANGNTYIILRGVQPELLSQFVTEAMQVYNYKHLPDILEHQYAEHLVKSLLFRLQMTIDAQTVTMLVSTVKVPGRSVENILQYIHDNYTTVSMKELVKTFGYSERQLLRFIKKYTGTDFNGCVMADRIYHAERLLAMTNLPIPRVAEMIGLESTSYFSRMFHSQTGLSPLAFRKQGRAARYAVLDAEPNEAQTE